MATSPAASSSSAPTASAAAAATMDAEDTEGPMRRVVSKRLRALRKKYNHITQIEESLAAGKTLNKDQEDALRLKPVLTAQIDELERLRTQLTSALAEELSSRLGPAPAAASSSDSDSSVQVLLALVYFGSLFNVEQDDDSVHRCMLERNSCLTYSGDDLAETDLNAVVDFASLAASRPPAADGVSHRDALQACVHHACRWLHRTDEPIRDSSTITYAGLRAKLDNIMASGYYTAAEAVSQANGAVDNYADEGAVEESHIGQLKANGAVDNAALASFGAGDAQQEGMVIPPQAQGVVEESHVGQLKDEVKMLFLLSDDESEIRGSFKNYIHPSAESLPVVETRVSGDQRTCLHRSDRARGGTCALTAWYCALHSKGYVLVCDLSIEDFVVDHLSNLRCRKAMITKISSNMTEEMVGANMVNASHIIKTGIHLNLPVPPDLHHLLEILNNYTTDCSPLVISHASHYEGDGKTKLYTKMLARLKVMASTKPSVHAQIMHVLGQLPEVSGWIDSAMHNVHLHSVLRYQPGVSRKTHRTLISALTAFMGASLHYFGDIDGMLDLRRNSQAHLETDYSVDEVGSLEVGLYGAMLAYRMFHQTEQQKFQTQQENLEKEHFQGKQDLSKEMQDLKQGLPRDLMEQIRNQRDKHHEELDELLEQRQRGRWQDQGPKRQRLLNRQRREREELMKNQVRDLKWQREQLQRLQGRWESLLQRQQAECEQQKQEQQKLQELLKGSLPQHLAPHIASTLDVFLSANQFPLDAAKAGAATIVELLWNCPASTDRGTLIDESLNAVTQGRLQAAAISEGTEQSHAVAQGRLRAAAVSQGRIEQIQIPSVMFNASEISDIVDIVSPTLVVVFQKGMFEHGEDYRLGHDLMVPKLVP